MMTKVLSMIVVSALTSTAAAQPTAFTYQGRLTSASQPAAGLHDLRFRLFDAASGGAQVGAVQCADNVPVGGGLFTVAIDFGPQFITPSARFLEIDVRADTGQNCSSPSGFVTLTPRQLLTAAPLATHARSAFALAAADGSPASAVSVDGTGNVGIGTVAPVEPLHIAFPVPVINLQDSDSGASGQVGLLSFRNNVGLETGWLGFGSSGNAHAHFMNIRSGGNLALGTEGLERLTILPAGNVGIGTIAPASRLHVRSTALGSAAILAEAFDLEDGVSCTGFRGVFAIGTHTGVVGHGFNSGVFGSPSTNTSGSGVFGAAFSADTDGVHGLNTDPNGVAVHCNGKFTATGTKSFCIDHPLDPENKLLYHYCAEGPEPINAYSGNIRTDTAGMAVVTLPTYFEEINRDFRYQLTVVDDGDGFVLAKVARRVQGNSFAIRTSAANILVSWRVEGVRNDRYVRSAASPVEVYKNESERGRFLRPDLYGAGPERAIDRGLPVLGARQE